MASFLMVVDAGGGKPSRYYVGGCRVSSPVYHSLGTGQKSCLQTTHKAGFWHHRYEQAL